MAMWEKVRGGLEIVEKRVGDKEISLYIGEREGQRGYFFVVRREVAEGRYKNSGLFIPFGSDVGYDLKSGKEMPLSPSIKDFIKEHTDPEKISRAKEIASKILDEERRAIVGGYSDVYGYLAKQAGLIDSFRRISPDYKLDSFLYWVWKEKYHTSIDTGFKENLQRLYDMTPQEINLQQANKLSELVKGELNEYLKSLGIAIDNISILKSNETNTILGFAVEQDQKKNIFIVVPETVNKIEKDVFYQTILHEAGHFVNWNKGILTHHLVDNAFIPPLWQQNIKSAFSGLDERLADDFARETLPMLNNKVLTQETNCGNTDLYPDIIERVYLQKGEGRNLIQSTCIEELHPQFWHIFAPKAPSP